MNGLLDCSGRAMHTYECKRELQETAYLAGPLVVFFSSSDAFGLAIWECDGVIYVPHLGHRNKSIIEGGSMPSSVSVGENVAQIPINQQSKNIFLYSGDRKLNLPTIVITVAAPHTSANCHQSKEAATNEGSCTCSGGTTTTVDKSLYDKGKWQKVNKKSP